MGAIEGNIFLDVLPLSILPLNQPILAETKGLGNEKAVGADADLNAELGRKETDSSPVGKKRGAEFPVERIYH